MRTEIKEQIKLEVRSAAPHIKTATRLAVTGIRCDAHIAAVATKERTVVSSRTVVQRTYATGRQIEVEGSKDDAADVLEYTKMLLEIPRLIPEVVYSFDWGHLFFLLGSMILVALYYEPIWAAIIGKDWD